VNQFGEVIMVNEALLTTMPLPTKLVPSTRPSSSFRG
jgi:hypothetical protein